LPIIVLDLLPLSLMWQWESKLKAVPINIHQCEIQ
jgi:hypothetical protein